MELMRVYQVVDGDHVVRGSSDYRYLFSQVNAKYNELERTGILEYAFEYRFNRREVKLISKGGLSRWVKIREALDKDVLRHCLKIDGSNRPDMRLYGNLEPIDDNGDYVFIKPLRSLRDYDPFTIPLSGKQLTGKESEILINNYNDWVSNKRELPLPKSKIEQQFSEKLSSFKIELED